MSDRDPISLNLSCEVCGEVASTLECEGWEQAPPGWWVLATEEDTLFACSLECAQAFSDDDDEEEEDDEDAP